MCGRFTLAVPPELLADHFGLETVPALEARFNIAPSQQVPTIRLTRRQTRRLDFLRWGLVPHWARDQAIGGKLINARVESAYEKPAFREAWQRRRCLIPADGFYEWSAAGQPFFFYQSSAARDTELERTPIALAGLWERCTIDDRVLDTIVILTTAAEPPVSDIHDRMPLIVSPKQFDHWLQRKSPPSLEQLMRPGQLCRREVGRRINNVQIDDSRCLDPPAQTSLL
jgi:putative SOS response-associated peptidase YedK